MNLNYILYSPACVTVLRSGPTLITQGAKCINLFAIGTSVRTFPRFGYGVFLSQISNTVKLLCCASCHGYYLLCSKLSYYRDHEVLHFAICAKQCFLKERINNPVRYATTFVVKCLGGISNNLGVGLIDVFIKLINPFVPVFQYEYSQLHRLHWENLKLLHNTCTIIPSQFASPLVPLAVTNLQSRNVICMPPRHHMQRYAYFPCQYLFINTVLPCRKVLSTILVCKHMRSCSFPAEVQDLSTRFLFFNPLKHKITPMLIWDRLKV